MNREQWQPFLKRWSEEWIDGHDPERDGPLDEEAVRDGWLGFVPASADEVAAAEARLGRELPPSLREFLLTTNGWRDAGNFIYRLAGTSELAWLADTDEDSGWIDAYSETEFADEDMEPEGEILARSLRLSLDGDAAVMLLDPKDVDERGEWAGYWLASWSGMGPERFDSFYDLMHDQYTRFHSLRRGRGESES
ncbi:SMI1/KNR4 family protein [Streptomyces piniterrae]|nr:SMI1/KNR4 family protein [Streptomyces piniterrae]